MKLRHHYLIALHDIFMAGVSVIAALYLRLGNHFVEAYPLIWRGSLCFALLSSIVFALHRLHQGVWRYVSLKETFIIARAVTISLLLFLVIWFWATRLENFPRSVLVIQWMLLIGLLVGPRLAYRLFKDQTFHFEWKFQPRPSDYGRKIPLLLVGANDRAESFIRELSRNPEALYEVVGIIDDQPLHRGRTIHHVKIYGDVAHIPNVIRKLELRGRTPQKIIVAYDYPSRELLETLLELSQEHGLTLARLPRTSEIQHTVEGQPKIEPFAIEDLLGRPQKALNRDQVKQAIYGKRVLVTGGGGTIGSELVRQIASYQPSSLSLFEVSEFNLYQLDHYLTSQFPAVRHLSFIGDVRDQERLEEVFSLIQPELVFHAAALKHVPLVEENPYEGILTNIFGTKNIVDISLKYHVERVVLISTDKAVNPTNIMGFTKRIAEKYLQAAKSLYPDSKTQCIAVRFGNVLGSSGSVIPLFQKQLQARQPLTVTHPDIERYFMTVQEAVELVLQASSIHPSLLGHAIYVLDMGEPVKILELAEKMIRMAGLRPHTDIPIHFTGLRAGEKLYEELFYPFESPQPTEYLSILRTSQQPHDHEAFLRNLDLLLNPTHRTLTLEQIRQHLALLAQ